MNVSERIKNLELPIGIYKYCQDLFKNKLDNLYYPDMYILPLTPEGEEILEYISDYHHDDKGQMVWDSIYRYGAHTVNVKYQDETYNVILVNND
jgi:hypothetical protein